MKRTKEFAYFDEISYSRTVKMKSYLKFAGVCSLSALCAAGIVIGTTVAMVNHNNSVGQGGLDMPTAPELINEAVTSSLESEIVQAVAEPAQNSDTSDRALSYVSYRVKQGDMIGYIADAFGVTQDTIISVNNIKSSRLLQIGQYLKIPSMPGILYTVKTDGETTASIAEKYGVDAEKISLANNVPGGTVLTAGTTVFVPDAAMDWVTRQEINGDLFINPLPGVRYWISSPYGWRSNPFNASRRTFHGGMDMACAAGGRAGDNGGVERRVRKLRHHFAPFRLPDLVWAHEQAVRHKRATRHH